MGEDTAHSMGVRVPRFSAWAVLVASLTTALAVSWGGLIGFVGLIVPHVLRWWIGPLHARLVPACAVAGGILMVLVDGVARAALAPSEIPAQMKAALVFDKVCASVGRNRLLLDGVSLEVPERGLLGIVGPNGSGKTTLLRAALGLMPLSAGQVLLGGRALGQWPA
eukprot:gene8857-11846_t